MNAPRSPRAAYTILEVLVAMALFLVLAVPLAWATVWTAQGKSWARDVDDALAVAREEWGTVRRIPAKRLRDTTREAVVGDRVYRVVRTVSDTAVDTLSLSSAPALGAPPPSRPHPAVRVCVLRPAGLLDPDDTLRCFAWRVPLAEIQP